MHNLRMLKHTKLTTPYADQHLFAVAVQFNKVYLSPLSTRALAGIAVRQINAIH